MQTVANLEDNDDERQEKVVVGSAVALALVVALGFVAHKQGLLDRFFGDDVIKAAAPIVGFVHAESGGDPEKILVSGFVADAAESKRIESGLQRAFPGSEIKNAVRIDTPRPGQKKTAKKSSTIRVSFAADAVNEAWPRPRFGDVKRLELVAKEGKLTVRGAVFGAAAKARLEAAFAALATDSQGVLQLRDVQRPAVPADQLQQSVSSAAGGRVFSFDGTGAFVAGDVNNTAILDAVAPQLKDLRGLELWISAGADDRAVSLKQAETIRDGLVSRGADAGGLRPVAAPKNNPLGLIVREKE